MSYHGRHGRAQGKRKNPPSEGNGTATEDNSPVAKIFRSYQVELDTRYDKYERLVKQSRDLTIESKRIIFLLHRVSSGGNNEEVLLEAAERLSILYHDVISTIISELSKREVYQFIKAFSGGLQEFVEAVSFYHYLKKSCIISIDEVHSPDFLQQPTEVSNETSLKANSPNLPFSEVLLPTDYILGIADLTGELMRKCINSVAAGDIDEPFRLCFVLQNIYEAFLSYGNWHKELKRKIFTLKGSLQKVENACYAIKIRGSEIPKHLLADFFNDQEDYKDSAECDL